MAKAATKARGRKAPVRKSTARRHPKVAAAPARRMHKFVVNHLDPKDFKIDGLRTYAKYRDLGIKAGTKGDFVAHLIRHNGKKVKDQVQQWHVHDCSFQLVYVMNGWATFEYEGQGQRTIRKGDCILQVPGIKHREIACSEDFEVLEIVSPGDFATRIVEAPQAQAAHFTRFYRK